MNATSNGDKGTKCVMCGKTMEQKTQILVEVIDRDNYIFDSKDCIVFFKKFKSLYGDSFNA